MKTVGTFLTVMVVALLLMGAPVSAQHSNILQFKNETGDDAVVRVFSSNTNSRVAEVRVPNGKTRGTRIRRGGYYIVVKYPAPNGTARYGKGDPFRINPPSGQWSRATITLHSVFNGNYQIGGGSREEFER